MAVQKTIGPRSRRKTSSSPVARNAIADSSPQVLHAASLSNTDWLVHGFSTRHGGVSTAYGEGSLNLGQTEQDTAPNVAANRRLFVRALALKGRWQIADVRQIHSSIIHRVASASHLQAAGDGLITNIPGVLLAIKTADCLPILLADTTRRAVGAFHAGWRGTVARIVEKGIGEMRKQFGSEPHDIVAAIGPGIHRCCYTVGEELVDEFASQFSYAKDLFSEVYDFESLHNRYPMLFLNQRAPGHGEPATKIQLDLVEANRHQLLDAGVPAGNIFPFEDCTSCRSDLFFSYRAEHGHTGRMMAAIGIRE